MKVKQSQRAPQEETSSGPGASSPAATQGPGRGRQAEPTVGGPGAGPAPGGSAGRGAGGGPGGGAPGGPGAPKVGAPGAGAGGSGAGGAGAASKAAGGGASASAGASSAGGASAAGGPVAAAAVMAATVAQKMKKEAAETRNRWLRSLTGSGAAATLAFEEPRTGILGGQTRERKSFGSISTSTVAIFALLGFVWVIAIVVFRSYLVIVGGGLLGFLAVRAVTRVDDEGDGWLRAALLSTRRRLDTGVIVLGVRVRAPRTLWIPAVGTVPAETGELREIDVPTGAGTIVLLHQ
ncbi:hypothetical protein G5V59_27305, partial [Nocardioides sp. W3-2-3]|nr:hypothetical protein [Nocardioides convexus]